MRTVSLILRGATTPQRSKTIPFQLGGSGRLKYNRSFNRFGAAVLDVTTFRRNWDAASAPAKTIKKRDTALRGRNPHRVRSTDAPQKAKCHRDDD